MRFLDGFSKDKALTSTSPMLMECPRVGINKKTVIDCVHKQSSHNKTKERKDVDLCI